MYEQTLLRLLSRKLPSAMLFLLLAAISVPAQADVKMNAPAQYIPVTQYDPKRDAALDIQDAIREAERSHKHILLEVGGEWCSWCHTLDRFFQANPELLELRDKNFVTLKINFSEENTNKEVLSPYPAINGYPHIFFLDSHGKLLQSQDTAILESGKGYNLELLTAVLSKWAPSP